jgi:hypothetical protein
MAGLQPLDREVLLQVVQGKALLGQDTLRVLRNSASLKPTIARVRKALDNLKRAGILAKPGGSYIVEDRLFAEYLATITDSVVPDPIPKSAGNRAVVEYHQKSREKK